MSHSLKNQQLAQVNEKYEQLKARRQHKYSSLQVNYIFIGSEWCNVLMCRECQPGRLPRRYFSSDRTNRYIPHSRVFLQFTKLLIRNHCCTVYASTTTAPPPLTDTHTLQGIGRDQDSFGGGKDGTKGTVEPCKTGDHSTAREMCSSRGEPKSFFVY